MLIGYVSDEDDLALHEVAILLEMRAHSGRDGNHEHGWLRGGCRAADCSRQLVRHNQTFRRRLEPGHLSARSVLLRGGGRLVVHLPDSDVVRKVMLDSRS